MLSSTAIHDTAFTVGPGLDCILVGVRYELHSSSHTYPPQPRLQVSLRLNCIARLWLCQSSLSSFQASFNASSLNRHWK
jgi:hypothetical protein